MTEHKVSIRYARAIFSAAVAEKLDETVYNDLLFVDSAINACRELSLILRNPIVQNWKKKKILEELLGNNNSHALTKNFLLLLCDKKREALISNIIREYIELYNDAKGLIKAIIVTAIDIDDEMKAKIAAKIEEWTKKTIIPEFKIDSSIKGGIKIQIQDQIIDASISKQLEKILASLSGAVI